MLALSDTVWVSLIGVLGSIALAIVTWLTNKSLKNREKMVGEQLEAYEQRGLLVSALKERIEYLESRVAQLERELGMQNGS